MRRWVYKAIDVVLSLLLVVSIILGYITMAVLTEFGLLPDIAWIAVVVMTIIAAGVLIVIWKY